MAGQGKGGWPVGQWGGKGWGSEGVHGPLVCGGWVLPACEGDLLASVLTGRRCRGGMSMGTYSAVATRAGVGDSPLQLRAMTELPKPQAPRLESRDNSHFLTGLFRGVNAFMLRAWGLAHSVPRACEESGLWCCRCYWHLC